MRLWAVRHIGTISAHAHVHAPGPAHHVGAVPHGAQSALPRQLDDLDRPGLASRLVWMLPIAWAVFALQYGTMVIWEEARLRSMFGRQYDRYARDVPRWLPWRPNDLAPPPPGIRGAPSRSASAAR
jgi:hypothetical protein